jgi:hypothetical protein
MVLWIKEAAAVVNEQPQQLFTSGYAEIETPKYKIVLALVGDVVSVARRWDRHKLLAIMHMEAVNKIGLNTFLGAFIIVSPVEDEPNAELYYSAKFEPLSNGNTLIVSKQIMIKGNLKRGYFYRLNGETVSEFIADVPEDIGLWKLHIDIFERKEKIANVVMAFEVMNEL